MEVALTPKADNCMDTSQVLKRLVPIWYCKVSFQFALTFRAQCMKHMQWGLMHLCIHLQDMSENSSFTAAASGAAPLKMDSKCHITITDVAEM